MANDSSLTKRKISVDVAEFVRTRDAVRLVLSFTRRAAQQCDESDKKSAFD
jgi:hypothetical protein